MKKAQKSKFYLIGLVSVIALGAFITFAYATNENSSIDTAEQNLSKGAKAELALLKCGEEGEEKKCGEEKGEKKCGEGEKKECEGKEKKSDEGDKKCDEGEKKKCGDGEAEEEVKEEADE